MMAVEEIAMSAPLRRTTRQHRAGNSFSVRIPRDMAYANPDQELEIEAIDDTLVLRPKEQHFSDEKRPTFDEMFRELDALRREGALGPDDNALVRPEWPEHRLPK